MTTIRWLIGGNPPAWLARQPFWLLVLLIAIALAALFAALGYLAWGNMAA
jgi:hypothetical protein